VNSLLYNLPWESSHAVFRAIGAAWLILAMIMFAVFSFLTILRYTIYPRIFLVMIRHETHSLFLGCIPMGFVTIVSGICLTGHEYGLDTLDTGLVLWWIALGQFSLLQCSSPRLFVAVLTALDLSNAVMSLLTSFGVPCVIFSAHRVQAETFTAAWLLPMVPPSTVAAVGTSICKLLLLQHRYSYAFVVLITSYVILGIALCTAIGIMVRLPLALDPPYAHLQRLPALTGAVSPKITAVPTSTTRSDRFGAFASRSSRSRRIRSTGSCESSSLSSQCSLDIDLSCLIERVG